MSMHNPNLAKILIWSQNNSTNKKSNFKWLEMGRFLSNKCTEKLPEPKNPSTINVNQLNESSTKIFFFLPDNTMINLLTSNSPAQVRYLKCPWRKFHRLRCKITHVSNGPITHRYVYDSRPRSCSRPFRGGSTYILGGSLDLKNALKFRIFFTCNLIFLS